MNQDEVLDLWAEVNAREADKWTELTRKLEKDEFDKKQKEFFEKL